ncbi:MAG: hypothetical protein RsTaC01_0724 [Candidatus Paraimprobicoccus trichonymphae]|uniref:Uncharacterized protein n=1 Tax=Candidatus Paraimprobicoccus trichonymphae TaxID=3033793 RepID=A0AA48KXW7_9FIRM|nr:MAG: hypothetical protein RsTaC01_0724 [Candidatus Paraimprobicoccus trichonymphae]
MKKNLRLKSILALLLLISSSIGLAAESNEKDKKSLVSPIVQTVGAGLGVVGTSSLIGGMLSEIIKQPSNVIALSIPGSISAVALGNGIYRIVSKSASSKTGGIVSLTTGVLSTGLGLLFVYISYNDHELFVYDCKSEKGIQNVFINTVAPVAILASGLTLIGSSIYTFATCPKTKT